MADHPNAVLMRRAYDAFGSGDLDALRDMMTENAEWHEPGDSLIAGDYIGRDRVLEFFGKLFNLSDGTFRADVIDILADDERAVSIQHSTGTRDGKRLDTRDVIVTEIHDGKITNTQLFAEDEHNEDDFWS